MASEIFKSVFDRHIEHFVGTFSEDSTHIYKNEKEKLIHPGEYGRYREESCKSLLRLILDKHVNISDGFVITSDNSITSQCDIIIYNSDISPLIADGIARMFPAEEVRMIGEIKSTLSRKDFIDALRKLAENKKKIIEGRCGHGVVQKEENCKMYDTVGSFLLCNKLSFNYDELTYDEIYGDIDRKYWHNIVLSVEDVTMNYLFRLKDFSQKVKDIFISNNMDVMKEVAFYYPTYEFSSERVEMDENHIHIRKEDKYAHIKSFCIGVASCCKEVRIYQYDPIVYLGMGTDLIKKQEIIE